MYLIANEHDAVLTRQQQAAYIQELMAQEAVEKEEFILRQKLFSVVKNQYST